MTPVYGVKIDLSEIKALEITCNKCSSVIKLAMPIANVTARVNCGGCGTLLWGADDPDHKLVIFAGRHISNYIDAKERAPFTIGFTLPSSPGPAVS